MLTPEPRLLPLPPDIPDVERDPKGRGHRERRAEDLTSAFRPVDLNRLHCRHDGYRFSICCFYLSCPLYRTKRASFYEPCEIKTLASIPHFSVEFR